MIFIVLHTKEAINPADISKSVQVESVIIQESRRLLKTPTMTWHHNLISSTCIPGSKRENMMSGWLPIFDTIHGVRGEVNVQVGGFKPGFFLGDFMEAN